ncbi:hypothetical protein EON65_39645 [archaeon]|nr:MAG: hypothetical protein EON65_39645 [archaeon]
MFCRFWLATCSKDHTSRLWHHSASGWQCKAVCTGHTEAVSALAISQFHATYASRKAFMITGAADRVIKKFSLPLHTFTTEGPSAKILSVFSARAHEKDINCIALSPNDQIAATASQDKLIKLWNTEDLSVLATLKGHKRGVWKVMFSPVDKVLLSCSGDRTMKLWSVVDYTQLRTIEGHSASVLNAIYVNYSTQIMSCAADGLVRLNTVKTGECEHTADEHADRVWALAALPMNMNSSLLGVENKGESGKVEEERLGTKFICSGGSDGRLVLWKDMTVEEEQKRIEEEEGRLVIEQQLNNHMSLKRYKQAIQAALSLNMSNKLLQIFTAILEEENTAVVLDRNNVNMFNTIWSKRLDQYVKEWSEDEIKKIVVLMKEWNANSRYCYICQILIHSLFRHAQCDKLMSLSEFKEALPALLAYTDRHYQRINRLSEASFLLEYVAGLASIPIAVIPNGSSQMAEESVVDNATEGILIAENSKSDQASPAKVGKVNLVSGSEDEQEEKGVAAEPTHDSLASDVEEAPATASKRKRTKKTLVEEPPTPDTRKSSRAKKARV